MKGARPTMRLKRAARGLALLPTVLPTLLPAPGLATPDDWCIRPESTEYAEMDLRPGSGAKTVHFPDGPPGTVWNAAATYVLSPQGLLVSVTRRTLTGSDCTTTFERDDQQRLLKASTPCGEPWRVNKTYRHEGNTTYEQDPNGTVATIITPSPKHGKWQVLRVNLDRKVSMARGAVSTRQFDERCRRVGPIHATSDIAPPRAWQASVEPSGSGHLARLHSDAGLMEETEFDGAGLKIRERFINIAWDVRHSYTLDTRGNWIERKTVVRQAREGEPVDTREHVLKREIGYH